MSVLFVNSCVESKTTSKTYLLANSFIEAFRQRNPTIQITQLDLASERLSPLTYHDIIMKERGKWQKIHYARQLMGYDKIIIAAPIWDWGIPSLLRVYIEHICSPGDTFKYTERGYVGLCSGKKALCISAMDRRAATNIHADIEYLRAIFKLFGIDDFEQLLADVSEDIPADEKKRWNAAKENAVSMAAYW